MAKALPSGPLRRRLAVLPLRTRLSIPFFFLAFSGPSGSSGWPSSARIRSLPPKKRPAGQCSPRLSPQPGVQGRWAVSLASSFARNPEIAEALAAEERIRLIQLCYPWYVFMKEHYGITQFNFHTLPPRNFVRFQRLHEYGDDLSYRKTIADAVAREGEVFGLEKGLTGYGIRGVAPVFFRERMVGGGEIGFNFGKCSSTI